MSKEPLHIRPVANGYIVSTETRQAGMYQSSEELHVFTDAISLGAWVGQYYAEPAVTAEQVAKDMSETFPVDPEHNPFQLSDEQIGRSDGWRLLTVGEHKKKNRYDRTQFWDGDEWSETSDWSTNDEPLRTKLTPAELAKLT